MTDTKRPEAEVDEVHSRREQRSHEAVPVRPEKKVANQPKASGGKRKTDDLVLGGEPTINLLPPEVRQQRRARIVQERLGIAVLAAAAVVFGGVALSSVLTLQAQAELAAAQADTESILVQQQQYAEVTRVQGEVDLVEAARTVGMAPEIDWKTYLLAVQALLPRNTTIDSVAVDSASPLVAYGQADAPLQGARIGTLNFTITSPTLPDVPTLLVRLATLPGYADATPGSVTHNEGNDTYRAAITMHINSEAFANRFPKKAK